MASVFSAQEPNLGYLYQIRYGMLLLLKEQHDEATLLIETIDDITIETSAGYDAYQTKYHSSGAPNISNSSTDFWKTIRVWCDLLTSFQLSIGDGVFTLITTASVSPNSILSKLKFDTLETRNVSEIVTEMLAVADNSENVANRPAYTAFKALSTEEQKALMKKVVVSDATSNINQAKEKTLGILKYSSKNYEALFERLEGWFVGQIILQLQNQRLGVTSKEIQQVIWDISDGLKADNLPADFIDSIADDENQLSPYRDRIFVKQLNAIKSDAKTINHAISDYHRAFSQVSRWMRDGLISADEQIKYHAKLKDDWERKFPVMCGPIDGEGDVEMIARGKSFYNNFYVINYPQIFIKDRFKELYMVTGSCQMLANERKIGWHPNFQTIF